MATQIQLRRGTAAAWTSADPTLADGEIGFETDTKKYKIGDGSTAWVSLAYDNNFTDAQVSKLAGIAAGATVNDTDANLKNRANHTGTQTASTISDFDTEVANEAAVVANTAKVTNANHTGEVTGSGALALDKTSVTGKTLATIVGTDHVLFADASDSDNLKKGLVSDLAGGTPTSQATAIANTTTTSTTFTLADSMTLTPGAGDYIIQFGSTWKNDTDNKNIWVSIFVNGVQIDHSERMMLAESSLPDTEFAVATQAYVANVLAAQAIEIQWKVSGGSTGTLMQRTLIVQKV